MAYSPQDKLDFAIKDAKYSIGMSRGNSLACATQLACALIEKALLKQDNFEDFVYMYADKFHHFNQVSIDQDFQSWIETNKPKLLEELGIVDFEKNIIQEGAKL